MEDTKKLNIMSLRNTIQALFFIFISYAGIQFIRFVEYYKNGAVGALQGARYPSIEGFMPIGALVALKNLVMNWDFDPYHPAGLVLFITILTLSFLYKRAFCSWVCPVGAFSEFVGRIGAMIFGRKFKLPKFLDYPLRALKYILMGFFIFAIILMMAPDSIYLYVHNNPYYLVADVKLLDFFLKPSTLELWVMVGIVFFSVFIRDFWCRYLCPYGALLGLVSLGSLTKVHRNHKNCVQCGKCTAACPNQIVVQQEKEVASVECSGCMNCVNVCEHEALTIQALNNKKQLEPKFFAGAVIVTFFAFIILAKLTGHWDTAITAATYKELVPIAEQLSH